MRGANGEWRCFSAPLWPAAMTSLGLAALVLATPATAAATEILGRGLLCLPRGTSIYCGWRLLPGDAPDVGFNLYRATSVAGPFTRVNGSPITGSTGYSDPQSSGAYYYKVRSVAAGGVEGPESSLARVTAGAAQSFITLSTQANTSISRVVPGDLNGDGVLDFAVLTPAAMDNCAALPSFTSFFLEGLLSENGGWVSRWRVDTRVGTGSQRICSHQRVPLAVWDLDGDGRAEVVMRYGANGGQLAVLDGRTGAVRATTAWPYWPATDNTQDRHVLVIARLRDVDGDGVADPFIVIQRGLYVEPIHYLAYRFDGDAGQLTQTDRLDFLADGVPPNRGFGQHGLAAADIDNDGRDEVISCGLAIEDTFTTKWIASSGHNDVCFVADLVPSQPGLEIFMGEEGAPYTARVVLQNGQLYGTRWPIHGRETLGPRYEPCAAPPNRCPSGQGCYNLGQGDYCYLEKHWSWERGWCAQLDADPELECFALEKFESDNPPLPNETVAHVFSADGAEETECVECNIGKWPLDWEGGEGIKELRDFCNPPGVSGCGWYTGWPGDLFGDAREESVIFNGTGQFRIYTNATPGTSRRVTPLADRGYRAALSRVGVGYNINFIPEPTHQARDDLSVPVECGNGVVEAGELCDGNCPTSCNDADPCTTDLLVGTACLRQCLFEEVGECGSGDGCCVAGCNNTNDADCAPVCGNGVVEAGELCDGNCPTVCDDGDPCTTDLLEGEDCSRKCRFENVDEYVSGDGCCPPGGNSSIDLDCAASCGNGVLEPGEACDGDCPTSCESDEACIAGVLLGSDCARRCTEVAITACRDEDGCCPPGCNAGDDSDCRAVCGNGVLEAGETCDGDCPSACDDRDPCTQDLRRGDAGACDVTCGYESIRVCQAGDGCCPGDCGAEQDPDCGDPTPPEDDPVPPGPPVGDGYDEALGLEGHSLGCQGQAGATPAQASLTAALLWLVARRRRK